MVANQKNNKKRISLNLFGLIFLLVGLGVLIAGPLHSLWQHADSSDWATVPAQIEQLSLAHKRDSDGGDQYQVTARYRYRWQGREYVGTRVSYDRGWDSLESEHRARHRYLNSYYRAGKSIPIRVNPEAPGEAWLLRELRWKRLLFMSVFAVIFAASGVAIMYAGRRPDGDPLALPAGPILSHERRSYWGLWAFGGLCILIVLPALLAVPDEWAKGNKAIVLALVFPLAGLWMIGLGVRHYRNWHRYGPAPLTLDPHPGQIGGDMGGHIQVARHWQQQDSYRVTLQCLQSYASGSGKNRRRSERLLWQQEQTAFSEGAGRGTELRFIFQPPVELPASEAPADSYHFWRLLLAGPRQPVALDRSYTVPLQRGTGRSRVSLPQRFVEDQQRRDSIAAQQAAASEIMLAQTGSGIRLSSRMGRHNGFKFGMLIFGLIFLASGGFLATMALQESGMLWVMAVPFLAIGVLMTLAALFMLGRSLEVEISDYELRWQRRWLGLPLRRRLLPLTSTPAITAVRSGSSNNGRQHTEYFQINAELDGKPLRIAEDIRGRDVAETLVAEIERWLSH